MEQARRDIEAETRRAIQEIPRRSPDLTVMATEKVTRKTLTPLTRAPGRRGAQRARLHRPGRQGQLGPRGRDRHVYARSLFEVAQERDALDDVRGRSPVRRRARRDRDLQVFFFSPYFSSEEKKDALGKLLDGADEAVMNFLELLVEKHRTPAIFRIRRELDGLWEDVNQLLPVTITSAIELDSSTVDGIARRSATRPAARCS